MAWQVEMFDVMSRPPSNRKLTKAFAVGTDALDNSQAHLINPISMDDYDAIPTKIVSPIHLWLATGRRVHAKSGIVLLQDGDEMPLMEQAARNCFYNLPLYRLKTLCAQQDLHPPSPDLLGHLTVLILLYLPEATDDEVRDILEKRAIVRENPVADLLADEALEQLFPQEDLKVVEGCVCVWHL